MQITGSISEYLTDSDLESIELQEINLNVCEEYKTKHEAAGGPNRMKRDNQIALFSRAQISELNAKRADFLETSLTRKHSVKIV